MTHIWKSPGSDLEVPRLPNKRDIAREKHLGVGVVHGGGGAQLLLLHLDLLLHLLAVRVEGDVAADLVCKQLQLKPLSTMMITLNHSGNTIKSTVAYPCQSPKVNTDFKLVLQEREKENDNV